MNLKRFIKVTPKGTNEHIVLLASNESFYRSQGATVEQPTEDEVLEFFPQLERKVRKTEDVVIVGKNINNNDIEKITETKAWKDTRTKKQIEK